MLLAVCVVLLCVFLLSTDCCVFCCAGLLFVACYVLVMYSRLRVVFCYCYKCAVVVCVFACCACLFVVCVLLFK